MIIETRPGSQQESLSIDILSEGVIEDLINQGRPPITDGGTLVAGATDDQLSTEYRVYIPFAGHKPDDIPYLFPDRELAYYTPDGRILRGFADHKTITFEEKIQIDKRVAAYKPH